MLFHTAILANYKLILLTWLSSTFLLINSSVTDKAIANSCKYCQYLVRTFMEGLNKTEQLHFGGGNTDWEERKLGKFKTSETRFVEVMEYVCKKDSSVSLIGKDLVKDLQFNCHTLAEEQEEHLENWFFNRQEQQPDLEKFLCVEELRKCCSPGHFGPQCSPCPGFSYLQGGGISRPCFGRGTCQGDGSRSGEGKCECENGYVGKMCSNCDAHYFANVKNSTFLECLECFDGCASGCNAEGPKGCIACRTGYVMDAETGCLDINECIVEEGKETEKKCSKDHEVCINTPGSYYCDCALGYVKRNKASGEQGMNAGDQAECVLDVEAKDAATSSKEEEEDENNKELHEDINHELPERELVTGEVENSSTANDQQMDSKKLGDEL